MVLSERLSVNNFQTRIKKYKNFLGILIILVGFFCVFFYPTSFSLSVRWEPDLIRIVNDTESDLNQIVNDTEGDLTPIVSDTDSDLTPIVNDTDSDLTPIVNDTDSDLTPIVKDTDSDLTSSIQESPITCHFPKLNPLDPSILKYVKKPDPVDCSKKYPILFKIELDHESGQFDLIQVKDFTQFSYNSCCFKICWNQNATKDLEKCDENKCNKIVKEKTKLEREIEMVRIECSQDDKNYEFVDMFGLIPMTLAVQEKAKKFLEENEGNVEQMQSKVNVAIFGMDAFAQANFIRAMPKSYEYLNKDLKAFEMLGYNKVGENTFPNLVAALMGRSVKEIENSCMVNYTEVDDCPFIWKKFSAQNYITSLGEEHQDGPLFDQVAEGFRQIPTDYYWHPVPRAIEYHLGHTELGWENICYGGKLSYVLCLDYLKLMAQSMTTQYNGSSRYFQFIWSTALTHGDINVPMLGDDYLLEALEWFHQGGYLNQTVLIVMSDHGSWQGDHLDTYQGQVEQVKPFIFFLFPPSFQLTYDEAIKNMIQNKNKLTTPFDLHETLEDLANLTRIDESNLKMRIHELQNWAGDGDSGSESGSSKEQEKVKRKWPRGISLFLPIPPDRSCEDAGIDLTYCVCRAVKPIAINGSELIELAAEAVVKKINEMVTDFPQCVNLTLDQVMDANIFQTTNDDIDDFASTLIFNASDPRLNDQLISLSISFGVLPSEATFKASVTRETNGEWSVSDEIHRSNRYGNQGHCVTNLLLRPYCFCS